MTVKMVAEGAIDGSIEGEVVGRMLGVSVGCLDGDPEGSIVVCTAVGAEDGLLVCKPVCCASAQHRTLKRLTDVEAQKGANLALVLPPNAQNPPEQRPCDHTL